ncbi:DUF4124 domain-containing protein [Halopseudomonas salegens]|uniref:DUF4124 domain-containing protein n=1 Tax=Halopseudomonas salegens TaxID=1434072 RepID=A0A1H2H9V3_9GAMM|nr:DUF4124 domain-containing protein [Halopseudomonas salegens]SDU28519.1 protein of unknown function [Halopseudomonas salegens]
MKRMLSTGLLTSLLAFGAQAQIYSWTDADGNRMFSDKPHPGAESIQIGPTNTIEPPEKPSAAEPDSAQTDPGNSQSAPYQQISIRSPGNDEAVRSNEGELTLQVRFDPPLSNNHLLRADIDGELSSQGVPGNGDPDISLNLPGMDRGTHQISAVVVDARGQELQRSSPITVHLQRTSLLQPGRQGSGQSSQPPSAQPAPNVPGGNN